MGNGVISGTQSLSLLPGEVKVTQLPMDGGSKVYVYLACNNEKRPKEWAQNEVVFNAPSPGVEGEVLNEMQTTWFWLQTGQ